MTENKTNFIKRWNILPKLLCVLVAFVIWLYVTAVESPDHEETIYQVPVNLVGVSSIESEYNLSVFSGYDETVDLTIKGQQSTISKYTVDDFNITADVSNMREGGRFSIDLSFDMPSGVTLSEASSKTIDVYIDEKTSTSVDIKPRVSYVSNYEIGDAILDYDVLIVSGPKKLIDEVDYAVVRVDVGTIEAKTTVSGSVVLVNKSGEDMTNPYLKQSRTEVKVTIPVFATKEVRVNIPFKNGFYTSDNAMIKITPETVWIKGAPDAVESVTSVNTTIVDEKKITSDTSMILALQLPDNVSLEDGQEENVNVSITHTGTITKTFSVENIKVTGADKLNYELVEKSLSVTIRGDSKTLKELEADDITIVVDLTGYEQSDATLSTPVTITVNADAKKAYAIGDYTIQVKLIEE